MKVTEAVALTGEEGKALTLEYDTDTDQVFIRQPLRWKLSDPCVSAADLAMALVTLRTIFGKRG